MLKLVHLWISAFRNVLNIDFDGTERVYLRKVLQPHHIAGLVIYLYQMKFKRSVRIPEEQGLQVNLWQLII